MIHALATILILLLGSALCAQTAGRHDVVITELMPDPVPSAGLPEEEYIELKNVSQTAFALLGWKISNGRSVATITGAFVLQPDSVLILCSTGNVPLFSSFGRTLGVSNFPSLDNDGDVVSLVSRQGRNIHAVAYKKAWYQNSIKSAGGWSLEMIDPRNACTGEGNWRASMAPVGGTPGKINSVAASNSDGIAPQLKRAFAVDSQTLDLYFDESLDSVSASITGNYSVAGGPGIAGALPLPPLFSTVRLQLASALPRETLLSVTVKQVTDCNRNAIGGFNTTPVALVKEARQGDVVINELLFNPKPGGSDYVELYNSGKTVVDAGDLFLAGRNLSGTLSSASRIMPLPFALFPGDYLVVTEDGAALRQSYFVLNKDAIVDVLSLPPLPDDKGTIVLLGKQGNLIDEVRYSDDWHFALLSGKEGVALERISAAGPSSSGHNWHSAAGTAGFGTPGYRNSQQGGESFGEGGIDVKPAIFSPDNDGRDDVAVISFAMAASGFVANVILFDAGGRMIRHLVRNALLGREGFWTWDGLDEKNHQLPMGHYIISTELFNLEGKKQSFRNTIVLARRLD